MGKTPDGNMMLKDIQRKTENLTIPTSAGPIAAVVHLPEKTPAPTVVCCHGMLSSKDSPKFIGIGNVLSREGIAVLRFDFSGSGSTSARLEKGLLESRVRDLHAVLDYLPGQHWAGDCVGLLGSSLGGFIALLVAAEASEHKVRAVVSWAAPFNLERVRLSSDVSSSYKHNFPPGFELGSPASLQGLPNLPRVLVVHGQRDELVPWCEAEAIYRKLGEPRRLLLMETADHRFMDPICRDFATNASLDWFREHGMAGKTLQREKNA